MKKNTHNSCEPSRLVEGCCSEWSSWYIHIDQKALEIAADYRLPNEERDQSHKLGFAEWFVLLADIEYLERGYAYSDYFCVVPAQHYVKKLHQRTENPMSYLCVSRILKNITANGEWMTNSVDHNQDIEDYPVIVWKDTNDKSTWIKQKDITWRPHRHSRPFISLFVNSPEHRGQTLLSSHVSN